MRITTVDSPVTPAPVVEAPTAEEQLAEQVQVPSHAPSNKKGKATQPPPPPPPARAPAGPIASGGGKEFQEALRTYKIKEVAARQIGTLAPRTPETEGKPSYLATVPATADTDFDALIDRYVEAFENGTADGRFALVIGVNGFERPGTEQRVRDAVAAITDRPLPFPVTVVGFTWQNSKVGPDGPDQRTIPYAAIRETIVRHPDAERALKGLVDQGDGTPAFIHTGDADVQAMNGGDRPLFNLADEIVTENPDAQVFSGGYRFPAGTNETAVLANQRDQAVRDGMAKADPRAIYYPEPNTLIRVSDAMPRLDNEITFGVRPKDGSGLKYTSAEGRGLAESVFSARKDFATPDKIAVYRSELAVTTESARLLQKYKASDPDGIPQSHADRKTWRDQVTRYLTEFHPGVDTAIVDSAEAIAFRSVDEISADDLKAAQTRVKQVHPREAAQHLWHLAGRTHQALNANPLPTAAQSPSPAPPGNPVTAVEVAPPGNPVTAVEVPPGGSSAAAVEVPPAPPRPADWQQAYDNAPPRYLRTERFVPSSRLTLNQPGGKLRGEITTIDFQVREFVTSDGTRTRAYDVHLDLVSRGDTVSPADRAAYAAQVRHTIETMINGRYTFDDGHRLHINLSFDTPSWKPGMLRGWQDDPARRPPVEMTLDPDADMHQHQWRANDNPALGVHEVMHYLGLKEGYASSERLFRSEDQPGVMGNDALDLTDDDTRPYLTPAELTLLADIAPQAGPVRSATSGPGPAQTTSHAPKAVKTKAANATGSSAPITQGGGKDFREALRNYRIRPVTTRQIGALAERTPATEGLPGYVATVPATVGTDFDALIDRYAEAFDPNTATGRFALVIGVNGFDRDVSDQQIAEAVARVKQRDLPFPVTVVGFTWHNPAIAEGAKPDQATIPYAAIRETIVRHPDAERALKGVVDGSDGAPVFLHTGDADVQSMNSGDAPLFNLTDRTVEANPTAQLISGGYRFPPGTNPTAIRAAERDLAVRTALAKTDPRAVYYPEPNTLVRIGDGMSRLDNEITFGVQPDPTSSTRKYTSMEGRGLAESVLSTRKRFNEGNPASAVVFDEKLAVTTESDRLLQKYDDGDPDSIPQSHADKKVWTDQIDRYLLMRYGSDYDPRWARALADSAFRSADPPTSDRQAEIEKIFKEFRQSHGKAEATEWSAPARVTHEQLKAHPFTEDDTQAPSRAPSAQKGNAAAPASTSTGPITAGGGKDFKDALRNFRIREVTTRQIGTLPPRTAATDGKPSYLATVPATVDTDLDALIDRYAEAFDNGTADGRFALVIGINGFDGKVTDQRIRDAVGRIRERPLPFPVSVVGFTWHNPAIKAGRNPDQRTIPYAAIRETIVRHPHAEQALSDLVGQGGDAPAFIHTGDADVQSMTGLFNRADAILQDDENVELLSGGYRFGAGAGATANTANQRDLAVREAMAKVIPRTVYLPEPNTLIRVTGPMTRLQNEVTFGVRTDPTGPALKYTSMEGRGLAESVISSRGHNADARGAVVFDQSLAVTTESDRLLQNYDPADRDGIPQSHADKKVWREQVDRYLVQQHPAVYRNDWAPALADLAFRSVEPPSATRQAEILGVRKRLKESVPADEFKRLIELAQDTDKALKAVPHAEDVQRPSPAPSRPTVAESSRTPDAPSSVEALRDEWHRRVQGTEASLTALVDAWAEAEAADLESKGGIEQADFADRTMRIRREIGDSTADPDRAWLLDAVLREQYRHSWQNQPRMNPDGTIDRPRQRAAARDPEDVDALVEAARHRPATEPHPVKHPTDAHVVHAHFSGEAPIHAAAMHLAAGPSNLVVEHDLTYFLDERRALEKVEPGVRKPAVDLIAEGRAKAERLRADVLAMGIPPERVVLEETFDTGGTGWKRAVSRTHETVAERFLADEEQARQTLRDHVLREVPRAEQLTAALDEKLGLEAGKPVVLLWVRRSGLNAGGAYPELDMFDGMLRQLADHARDDLGAQVVLVGDDPGRSFDDLTGKSLVQFWKTLLPGQAPLNRAEQLFVLDQLRRRHDAVAIGMESGAIEMPALLGMKTVYLEHRGMRTGKAERWMLVSGAAAQDPAGGDAQPQPGPVSTWRRQQFEAPTEWLFQIERINRLTAGDAPPDQVRRALYDWVAVLNEYDETRTASIEGSRDWIDAATGLRDRLTEMLDTDDEGLVAETTDLIAHLTGAEGPLPSLPSHAIPGTYALTDSIKLSPGELNRLTAQIEAMRQSPGTAKRDLAAIRDELASTRADPPPQSYFPARPIAGADLGLWPDVIDLGQQADELAAALRGPEQPWAKSRLDQLNRIGELDDRLGDLTRRAEADPTTTDLFRDELTELRADLRRLDETIRDGLTAAAQARLDPADPRSRTPLAGVHGALVRARDEYEKRTRFGGTTELDERLAQLDEAAKKQAAAGSKAGKPGKGGRGAKPKARTVTVVPQPATVPPAATVPQPATRPEPARAAEVTVTPEGGWLADGVPLLVRPAPDGRDGVTLLSDADLATIGGRAVLSGDGGSVVMVHGVPGDGPPAVRVPLEGGGTALLTPEQVARILGPGNSTITLLACHNGEFSATFARRLAEATGRDVLTPDGHLRVGAETRPGAPVSVGGRSWQLFTGDSEPWDVVNDERPFEGITAEDAPDDRTGLTLAPAPATPQQLGRYADRPELLYEVAGVDDLDRLVTEVTDAARAEVRSRIRPHVARMTRGGRDAVKVDTSAIENALRNDLPSLFVTGGRTFDVKDGWGRWHSVVVRPTRIPGSEAIVALEGTKFDTRVDATTALRETQSSGESLTVGTGVSIGGRFGPGGAVSGELALARASENVESSATVFDSHNVRSGKKTDLVRSAVTFTVAATKPGHTPTAWAGGITADVSFYAPQDISSATARDADWTTGPFDVATLVENAYPVRIMDAKLDPAATDPMTWNDASEQILARLRGTGVVDNGSLSREQVRSLLTEQNILGQLMPAVESPAHSPLILSPSRRQAVGLRMTAEVTGVRPIADVAKSSFRWQPGITDTGKQQHASQVGGGGSIVPIRWGFGVAWVQARISAGFRRTTTTSARQSSTTRTGTEFKDIPNTLTELKVKVTIDPAVRLNAFRHPMRRDAGAGPVEVELTVLTRLPQDKLAELLGTPAPTDDPPPKPAPPFARHGGHAMPLGMSRFGNLMTSTETLVRRVGGGFLPRFRTAGVAGKMGLAGSAAERQRNQTELDRVLSVPALRQNYKALLNGGVSAVLTRSGVFHDRHMVVHVEAVHPGDLRYRGTQKNVAVRAFQSSGEQDGVTAGSQWRAAVAVEGAYIGRFPGAEVNTGVSAGVGLEANRRWGRDGGVETSGQETALHGGTQDSEAYDGDLELVVTVYTFRTALGADPGSRVGLGRTVKGSRPALGTDFQRDDVQVRGRDVPRYRLTDRKPVRVLYARSAIPDKVFDANPVRVEAHETTGLARRSATDLTRLRDYVDRPAPDDTTVSEWEYVESMPAARTALDLMRQAARDTQNYDGVPSARQLGGLRGDEAMAEGMPLWAELTDRLTVDRQSANLAAMTEAHWSPEPLTTTDGGGQLDVALAARVVRPRIVAVQEETTSENAPGGGTQVSGSRTRERQFLARVVAGFSLREPSTLQDKVGGGATAQAGYQHLLSYRLKRSREKVGGFTERNVNNRKGKARTYLVVADLKLTAAAEVGAPARFPRSIVPGPLQPDSWEHHKTIQHSAVVRNGVYLRLTEAQAIKAGLLTTEDDGVSVPHGPRPRPAFTEQVRRDGMSLPPGRSAGQGLQVFREVPSLVSPATQALEKAIAEHPEQRELLEPVLNTLTGTGLADPMLNRTRMLQMLSRSGVKRSWGNLFDGGVSLIHAETGKATQRLYDVRLEATLQEEIVFDGFQADHDDVDVRSVGTQAQGKLVRTARGGQFFAGAAGTLVANADGKPGAIGGGHQFASAHQIGHTSVVDTERRANNISSARGVKARIVLRPTFELKVYHRGKAVPDGTVTFQADVTVDRWAGDLRTRTTRHTPAPLNAAGAYRPQATEGDEPGWDSRNGLLVPPHFTPEDLGSAKDLQETLATMLDGAARRLRQPGYPSAHQVRSGLTPDVLLPNAAQLLSADMLDLPGVPAADLRMRRLLPKIGLVPVAARLAGLDSTVYREHITQTTTSAGTAVSRQNVNSQMPRLLLGRGYLGDPYQALENTGTGPASGDTTAIATGEDSGATSFGNLKPENTSVLIEYVTRPVISGTIDGKTYDAEGPQVRLIVRTGLPEARRVLGIGHGAPDAATEAFDALVAAEKDLKTRADAFVKAADAEAGARYHAHGSAEPKVREDWQQKVTQRDRREDDFWTALQRHYRNLDAFQATYVAIGDDPQAPPPPPRTPAEVMRTPDGQWLADGVPLLVTPAPDGRDGVTLLSGDDLAAIGGRAVVPPDGGPVVMVHGVPGDGAPTVRAPLAGGGTALLTPEQVARIVGPTDATITLLACYDGEVSGTFARRLAEATGADVLTPDSHLRVGAETRPGAPITVDGRSWQLFTGDDEPWDVINDEVPFEGIKAEDAPDDATGLTLAPAAAAAPEQDPLLRMMDRLKPLQDHVAGGDPRPIDLVVMSASGATDRVWVEVRLPGRAEPVTFGPGPSALLDPSVRVAATIQVSPRQLTEAILFSLAEAELAERSLREGDSEFVRRFAKAAVGHRITDASMTATVGEFAAALQPHSSRSWSDAAAPETRLSDADQARVPTAEPEALVWARQQVAIDHQRPLVTGHPTETQTAQLSMLDSFARLIAARHAEKGEESARELSRELGRAYGTARDFTLFTPPAAQFAVPGDDTGAWVQEFVELARPLQDHARREADNPAQDIEIVLLAAPLRVLATDAAFSPGHAVVAIRLPDGRQVALGFYPKEGLFGAQGRVNDDSRYVSAPRSRILASWNIDARRLADAYVFATEGTEADYHLLRTNCVVFATRLVEKALGTPVVDPSVTTPNGLIAALSDRSDRDWADRTDVPADLLRPHEDQLEAARTHLELLGTETTAHKEAMAWARFRVAVDHQRPLVTHRPTAGEQNQFAVLDGFTTMIAAEYHLNGERAAASLSLMLGQAHGTLRVPAERTTGPLAESEPVKLDVDPDTSGDVLFDADEEPGPSRPEPPVQTGPRTLGRRPERVADPVPAAEIAALRGTVLPRTADAVSFDVVELDPVASGVPDIVAASYREAGLPVPVTDRPRLSLEHVDGPVAYDHRVLTTADGRTVQDFTVRIHLDARDPEAAAAAEETRQRARAAVDAAFNHGFRIGDDQLHVTVEYTDDPAAAHTTVALVSTDTRATQRVWSTRSGDLALAHEIGHYLGLGDEYADDRRVLRRRGVTDDSLMATVQTGHDPQVLDRHVGRITATREGALGPETRPRFDEPVEPAETFPGPPPGGLADPLATPKPRRRLDNGVWLFPPPSGAEAFEAAASSLPVPEGTVVIAAALPPGPSLRLVSDAEPDGTVNAVTVIEQLADGADTVVLYLHDADVERSTGFAVALREVLDSHRTRLAHRRADVPDPHLTEEPGRMPSGLVVSATAEPWVWPLSTILPVGPLPSRWLVSMPGSARVFGPVGDLTLAVRQVRGNLVDLDLPSVLRRRLAGGPAPQGITDDDLAELTLREIPAVPPYAVDQPAVEPSGPLGDVLMVPVDPAATPAERLSAVRRSVRLGTVRVWPAPEADAVLVRLAHPVRGGVLRLPRHEGQPDATVLTMPAQDFLTPRGRPVPQDLWVNRYRGDLFVATMLPAEWRTYLRDRIPVELADTTVVERPVLDESGTRIWSPRGDRFLTGAEYAELLPRRSGAARSIVLMLPDGRLDWSWDSFYTVLSRHALVVSPEYVHSPPGEVPRTARSVRWTGTIRLDRRLALDRWNLRELLTELAGGPDRVAAEANPREAVIALASATEPRPALAALARDAFEEAASPTDRTPREITLPARAGDTAEAIQDWLSGSEIAVVRRDEADPGRRITVAARYVRSVTYRSVDYVLIDGAALTVNRDGADFHAVVDPAAARAAVHPSAARASAPPYSLSDPAPGYPADEIAPAVVHPLPSTSLPGGELGTAGPLRPLPRTALTDDERLAWRTAPGHDRLPATGRFAVERLPADLTALHRAVEQALIASGSEVDDATRAAIRDGLTVSTVTAGLAAMTEGEFPLPVPVGLDRHVAVDARLVTGPAFAGADATTRALCYRVEFRVIARSAAGSEAGGVGVSVADAAIVRMDDADAERITGRELPAGDPAAGRIVWQTEHGDRVVGSGGYDPAGTPLFPGDATGVLPVFDAYDPATGGRFDLSHPTLASGDELQQVLAYLAEGRVLLRTAARERDVYDPDGPPVVPLGYCTDGRWVWSEATAYYLATYGLSPDSRLLADIRANGYRVPPVGGRS